MGCLFSVIFHCKTIRFDLTICNLSCYPEPAIWSPELSCWDTVDKGVQEGEEAVRIEVGPLSYSSRDNSSSCTVDNSSSCTVEYIAPETIIVAVQ